MRYMALLAMVLGSLVPCQAQAQNLIPNPEFDSGITGWTPPQFYNFLAWDPVHSAFGPGGSAVMNSPFGIEGTLGSFSSCVPVTPGVTYSWGGQYRFGTAIATDFVQLSAVFFNDPGCTSGIFAADTVGESPQSPLGEWRILAGPDVTAPPGATGALIAVYFGSIADAQTHSLSFDDVYFGRQGTVGPKQGFADVPTLSPISLCALALALGAAALWLLRRGLG